MNLKELYLEIYRSRPESILRFMLVSLFVWTLLTLLFGSLRATRRGWMWFNRILAGCAVLGILGITVFYRFIGGGGEVGINLVPFRVPEEAWRAEEYYRMLLMNAFLFFPERRILRRFGLTVLCGLALSLFCETMQGLFMLGTAETDDLLMNTAGVALGAVSALAAGVLSLPIRWLRKSGETSRK